MNWTELQSDWIWASALVKTHWTRLADEDLKQIGGRRDQLASCLERLYGYGKEEAEREIASFEKDVRFPGAVK